ncbi:MAG: MopE-related protein [Myxococcota bacterium]|nr:MopE-related protein [Myxococcota bacterium]
MRVQSLVGAMIVLCWVGCGGPPPVVEDAGADGASEDLCRTAADCSDGVFCSGAETCAPGPGADSRGCRTGTACMPDQICDEAAETCTTACAVARDADGDGSEARECGGDDCDDSDPLRRPGLPEICDAESRDEDCDDSTFGERDVDGDGHVDAACCNPSASGGEPACGDDCDDTRASVYAGLVETCDTIDNDCDTAIDEGVSRTVYRDLDGDLHGDPAMSISVGCELPDGYSEAAGDCDDSRADRNPSTVEACDLIDNDCDDLVDDEIGSTYYIDGDGDGFGDPLGATVVACSAPSGYSDNPTDCDDTRRLVNPATTELCDGIDNNCSGTTDESGPRAFFRDFDGDGSGDPGEIVMTTSCVPPPGYVASPDDCDDRNAAVHLGATELCNGLDDDCSSGVTAGGLDPSEDADGDMHSPSAHACTGGPFPKDDCNDSVAAIHGGATEICDGLDDDCSSGGGIEGSEDGDGDGHAPISALCTGGPFPRDDCNDAAPGIHGGAVELCDRIDSNCSSGGGVELAEDFDGDGHAPIAAACVGGYPRDDCDDSRAAVHPGAVELCDRLDTDCSSGGGILVSEDADGDLHASVTAACSGGFPRDDCNDANPSTYPGAAELCNRLDDDCSSGGGSDASEDADGDGFARATAACSGGFPRTDCDDFDASIRPGAAEVCDRIDQDCSSGGGVALAEDADGDGHAPIGALCTGGFERNDCVDTNAAIHPGAPEICDRFDNDCSSGGGALPGEDADGDLHAPIGAACSGGYPRDDCDDARSATHPGATEVCNRTDDDCSSGGGALTSEDADGDAHAPIGAACMDGFPRDDCDDTLASVHPGATEICDLLDNDCSSGGGALASEDADGDLHAPIGAACMGGYPRDDCDDTRRSVHPGATEICDRLDNDCSSGGGLVLAEDVDGDMHSPPGAACTGGNPKDDCDDSDPATYPGRGVELCDRRDNDCSSGGGTDTAEDFDDDGHAPTTGICSGGPLPADDCDDTLASRYPGAPAVTPSPRGMENGALTGSALALARGTLRPTLQWAPRGDCVATFDVQLDDSCPASGFGACTFASPESSTTGWGASPYQPPVDLPVSSAPRGLRYFWRVRACNAGGCSAWSTPRYLEVGRARADYDGDGYSDIAAGAYRDDLPEVNEGVVWLHGGAALGPSAEGAIDSPADEIGAFFGMAAAAADLDGDGYTDLAVGAPYVGAADEGAVYVFYGSATGLAAAPSLTLLGTQAGAEFGRSVAAAGDLDGDGYADLVVGAPMHDAGALDEGAAFVFYGSAAGIGATPDVTLDNPRNDASARFGARVAGIGDVDGDGLADLAIAAPLQDTLVGSSAGQVLIYAGASAGIASSPSRTIDTTFGAASQLGSALAGGDFDGDGIGDLAIGASSASSGGRVAIYAGSATGLGFAPVRALVDPTIEAGAAFGAALATGDVNGDRRVDLVVGSPFRDRGAADEGNAFVFLGSSSGLGAAPATTIDSVGNQANAHFGFAAAMLDPDGDGFDDVLIGAPDLDAGAGDAGGVHGFSGGFGGISTLPSWTLSGSGMAGSNYGYSIAR